jgi:hypothetical protein
MAEPPARPLRRGVDFSFALFTCGLSFTFGLLAGFLGFFFGLLVRSFAFMFGLLAGELFFMLGVSAFAFWITFRRPTPDRCASFAVGTAAWRCSTSFAPAVCS